MNLNASQGIKTRMLAFWTKLLSNNNYQHKITENDMVVDALH